MIILGVPLTLVTRKPARSPTLSALPPGFPAAHTGPLRRLHAHPALSPAPSFPGQKSIFSTSTASVWRPLESETLAGTHRVHVATGCPWGSQSHPRRDRMCSTSPTANSIPPPGGTAQTGSLCTRQLPSPWRSSISPRCGQCSSLSAPGHSTLLSSAAPPGSSGTPSSPGRRAARRPVGHRRRRWGGHSGKPLPAATQTLHNHREEKGA